MKTIMYKLRRLIRPPIPSPHSPHSPGAATDYTITKDQIKA